jgi:uncharacterized protein YydD (DUF2326 family)
VATLRSATPTLARVTTLDRLIIKMQKEIKMEKTETIKVRMTITEKERLFKLAANENETVSELVRRQLLQPIVTDSQREELNAFKERTQQIARIGNNLNQISRKIHEGKQISESFLIEIAEALRGLQ